MKDGKRKSCCIAASSASLERAGREVIKVSARVGQHLTADRPTRAALHEMLDACLDLEDLHRVLSHGRLAGDGGQAVDAGRPIAKALAVGAFAWMEQPTPHARAATAPFATMEWNDFSHGARQIQCAEAARRLSRAAHALPHGMVNELVNALSLLAAGGGELPAFFTPVTGGRRGANPRLARELEEQFWCWIFFEQGRGATIDQSRARVAKAAGVGTHAVDKWREGWMRSDGRKSGGPKRLLERWQRAGAMGRGFIEGWTLGKAAARWREARLPAKSTSAAKRKLRVTDTT